jgi:hypothetical protein
MPQRTAARCAPRHALSPLSPLPPRPSLAPRPQLLVRYAMPSGVRQKGSSSWLAETFSLSPMDGIIVSGAARLWWRMIGTRADAIGRCHWLGGWCGGYWVWHHGAGRVARE